jgi:hypothetical protein
MYVIYPCLECSLVDDGPAEKRCYVTNIEFKENHERGHFSMGNGMGFGNGMSFGMGNGSGFGSLLFMLLFFVGLIAVAIFIKNNMVTTNAEKSNNTYVEKKVIIISGTCSVCGKDLEQGWRVCPHCGKELKTQKVYQNV